MAKLLTRCCSSDRALGSGPTGTSDAPESNEFIVEGVSRTLDHFNMWKAAEPVVGDWIARNLGPQGMRDAKDGF